MFLYELSRKTHSAASFLSPPSKQREGAIASCSHEPDFPLEGVKIAGHPFILPLDAEQKEVFLKYLLNQICCLSSSGLVSNRKPDDRGQKLRLLSRKEPTFTVGQVPAFSSPFPSSPAGMPLLIRIATLTVPVLMVSLVTEPAKAWQRKANINNQWSKQVPAVDLDSDQLQSNIPRANVFPVVYHTIQQGDTLWELAHQYHLSAQAIAAYNQINKQDLLQIGDTLVIPVGKSSLAKQPELEATVGQTVTPQISQLRPLPLGGMGGAISSNQLELDASASEIAFSPFPQLVNQSPSAAVEDPQPLSSLPANVAPLLNTKGKNSQVKAFTVDQPEFSEQPIQQFLADVEQLQANYKQKTVQVADRNHADWNGNSISPQQEKVFSPLETSTNTSSSNTLATAPIKVEFYNPALSAPIGETVSPKLPPLSSPEQYLPNSPQKFNGYIWPAEGVFTSGYGMRWGRMHRGIDIAAPIGTPIVAAAPGEVVMAGWSNGGYGNLVKLKHPDGSLTLYAHNNKLLVHKGQEVDQGQQIAEMGSTGRSTGPHLHFEIHPAGQGARNPLAYLPKR